MRKQSQVTKILAPHFIP